MTTSKSLELELRMPPFAVALYGLSLVIAAVMVVVLEQQGFFDDAFGLVFPLFLGGILAFNTATALSRARAYADGSLEVRNRFRTRTLRRADIDRVMVGQQGGLGSPRRLELLLTDGDVLPVVGTEVPPLPGVRRRLEEQGEQLRAWAAGTPTPYR